ncbi:hypothetical protein [Tumebacillus flagellatus]|uniref:Uncharacterized protein n=1 Tax=Tumebacillus flagellatus TaxID=1157490 RepID=A0A074LSA2_9BACL|nr:hypothetical protein [Tumebacillus flagellatus]KEO82658.1 hypothetical protein EL26_13915 [Tumebacillus flagellatus]
MKIALPLAFLTLALLLLGALLQLTTQDLRMTEDLISAEQAQVLAESGVLHAEHRLAADPSWRGALPNIPCATGAYSVAVSDLGNGSLLIESTGWAGRSKKLSKKIVSFSSKH